MVCIDELKDLKIYKKQFILPFNPKERRKNSAILLVSPTLSASNRLMNLPYTQDKGKTYKGYYNEKDVMVYINHEDGELEHTEHDIFLESISEDDFVKMQSQGVQL